MTKFVAETISLNRPIIRKLRGATFDRTGRPDPLIMTFQIVAIEGKITHLTCRLSHQVLRD